MQYCVIVVMLVIVKPSSANVYVCHDISLRGLPGKADRLASNFLNRRLAGVGPPAKTWRRYQPSGLTVTQGTAKNATAVTMNGKVTLTLYHIAVLWPRPIR